MALEIKTSIIINASSEKIWKILNDFDNYNSWNPFIKSIKGNVNIGNKITVTIQPPNSNQMTFSPKVLSYETNKQFSWIGKLLFSGIFDGLHKFELIENTNNTITFIQSEKFTGILVPLFAKQLKNNTKLGFEAMNSKLKEFAEK